MFLVSLPSSFSVWVLPPLPFIWVREGSPGGLCLHQGPLGDIQGPTAPRAQTFLGCVEGEGSGREESPGSFLVFLVFISSVRLLSVYLFRLGKRALKEVPGDLGAAQ